MVVRHAVRHIRASQENMLRDFLDDYGWFGPDVPYGAAPIQIMLRAPREAELMPAAGNTVFISHGGEPDNVPTQLGGGLLQTEHVLFVDVLGENDGIALSIAADIKDRLSGQLGSRYLWPRHQATGILLPGYLGEYEDVMREQPNADLGAWQSIKATLVMDFPGEES